MAIDPVTALATAISEVASTIRMMFNGSNRKLLADVKRVKDMKKKIKCANDCLAEADLCVSTENKKYWKAKEKYDDYV